MRGYFCTRFIDFMWNIKRLTDFTNSFYLIKFKGIVTSFLCGS